MKTSRYYKLHRLGDDVAIRILPRAGIDQDMQDHNVAIMATVPGITVVVPAVTAPYDDGEELKMIQDRGEAYLTREAWEVMILEAYQWHAVAQLKDAGIRSVSGVFYPYAPPITGTALDSRTVDIERYHPPTAPKPSTWVDYAALNLGSLNRAALALGIKGSLKAAHITPVIDGTGTVTAMLIQPPPYYQIYGDNMPPRPAAGDPLHLPYAYVSTRPY